MSSQWLSFYRGAAADSAGRMLAEILAWDDEQLEYVHDYIQWLFPLPERSMFNPAAPLLSEADIVAARSDVVVQTNLRAAFARMMDFYGLTTESAGKPKPWICPADHNHLRLTRILRSLRLLGLTDESQILYEGISRYNDVFPARTKQFWRDAMAAVPVST